MEGVLEWLKEKLPDFKNKIEALSEDVSAVLPFNTVLYMYIYVKSRALLGFFYVWKFGSSTIFLTSETNSPSSN
ncbi:hypothetical protein DPMN_145637 [Dreissena polymorpha]|uniref:Uncharacterized protein n=1 Tax=Dreissena polymorpha TaxID=45954 RepID=A0A9D4F8U2_DREPO|nr:hypothetical protein DPMN_145637 [Dreissena polymorpha]